MKPRAASCAVGSELGLLFTFHKSREPVNPACKALGPVFYCSRDSLHSYCWTLSVLHSLTRRARPHCFTSRCGVSDYVWKCECACAYLHAPVSARCFLKNDQMTRWAVINELSTEHFCPSGKRVPWWSQPISGHRGRGATAQRALCLCQDSPEDSCTGPAHLDNTRLLTALHLSVLTQKSPVTIILIIYLQTLISWLLFLIIPPQVKVNLYNAHSH